ITGQQLNYAYGTQRVVDNVSLTTSPGRVLGLIGPNGSGKTTLLRLLSGSLKPQAGAVHIDDVPLGKFSPRENGRPHSVVVQQSAAHTTITFGDIVLLGRTPYLHPSPRTRPSDHRIAAEALERVGVAHLGHRLFNSLSGGERQRVLIA